MSRTCSINRKYQEHKILVGKAKAKRWIERSKSTLNQTGCEDMDWIHLAQDSDQWQVRANMVIQLQVP
jgi:hypothetical protein